MCHMSIWNKWITGTDAICDYVTKSPTFPGADSLRYWSSTTCSRSISSCKKEFSSANSRFWFSICILPQKIIQNHRHTMLSSVNGDFWQTKWLCCPCYSAPTPSSQNNNDQGKTTLSNLVVVIVVEMGPPGNAYMGRFMTGRGEELVTGLGGKCYILHIPLFFL